jgi:hypothetical protein
MRTKNKYARVRRCMGSDIKRFGVYELAVIRGKIINHNVK